MNIKDKLKGIVPATYSKIDKRYYELLDQLIEIKNRTMPKVMLDYEVQLVEHCNLNCARCSHFCPVAEEEYLDITEYEKDVKRLSQLFDGEANFIRIMGGEPLLHKKVNEFAKITRKYFKNAIIDLCTNGILIMSMDKTFFKTMKECNVSVSVTKYPIGIDYDKIRKKCEDNGVKFRFFDKEVVRKFNSLPLDEEGRFQIEKNFCKCYLANTCHTLKHGKMFTCSTIPHVEHYNKYFNKNLIVSNSDYIDIYKAKDKKEILEFLSKPVPFCRYCNVDNRKYSFDFEKSNKDINEW